MVHIFTFEHQRACTMLIKFEFDQAVKFLPIFYFQPCMDSSQRACFYSYLSCTFSTRRKVMKLLGSL